MKIQTTFSTGIFPVKLSPAGWLTLYYLILSILWILLSDALASLAAGSDVVLYEKIQAVKGIVFVILSGLFFYTYTRKLYAGIESSHHDNESLQQKYQALNEAAREGLLDYDYETDRVVMNNKMKFFFPVATNEIGQFTQLLTKRVHPDDVDRILREYRDMLKNKKQIWQAELRLLGLDGKYYRVISNAYLIRDQEGKLSRMIGAVQDISELRSLQTEYYEQKLKHKRTLAGSIIKAQENERHRWADELHDNVCQILSVANMYAIDLNNHPENLPLLGPQLKKLVSESIGEIRQLSATIRTPAFDQESLTECISHLSANINRLHAIHFNLDNSQFTEKLLDNDKKLMIYRVVQEQVNNIIKYAEATTVDITLNNSHGKQVEIRVKDNGKGFEPGKVKTGIGLRNIQSRLQVYNGKLEIKTAPGEGCLLKASFTA